MKVMLVDDEALALLALEKHLLRIGGMDIIGKYQNPEAALHAAMELRPDVIFLDIDMPVMSGIELAERLYACHAAMNIVFVTAYDTHAIKAFEVNAVDYLLKPLHPERLQTTITRLQLCQDRAPYMHKADSPPLLRCFSFLQFEREQPIHFAWRTTKAQELFAYLIHWRQKTIKKDTLLEMLWPDTDPKKGLTQLYSAIYQIRKLLESHEIPIEVHSIDKGYMLDVQQVRLDVDEWQKSLQDMPPLSLDTFVHHKELLELYRGDYLEDYDYIWAESERERLRAIWFQHAVRVANFMAESEFYAEALTLNYRIQQAFPDVEDIYWSLMKIYQAQGDYAAIKKQYTILCEILSEEFGTVPEPHITAWYEQCMVR
jgi:two-component SAPR family response regulator